MGKRLKIVMSLAVIFLLSFSLVPLVFANPYSTITSGTTHGGFTSSLIQYNNYIYAFYVLSSDNRVYYKSSVNGINWGTQTLATNDATVNDGTFRRTVFTVYNF